GKPLEWNARLCRDEPELFIAQGGANRRHGTETGQVVVVVAEFGACINYRSGNGEIDFELGPCVEVNIGYPQRLESRPLSRGPDDDANVRRAQLQRCVIRVAVANAVLTAGIG